MLSRMERHGWLRSRMPTRAKAARHYRITKAGRAMLARRRDALQELYDEVGRRRELPAGTGVQVRLSSVRSCITCAAQSRAVVSRSPISATRVAPDLSASKLASWRATSAARG